MAIPKRGEIWWVRLDPTQGSEINKTRPCIVISDDVINQLRRTVVVIPLSSAPQPHPPLLVRINIEERPVVAVVDQIRAVSKERLMSKMGNLSAGELDAIEQALLGVLGIS